MDNLTAGITEASKELNKQKQSVQKSPGQTLRRIQSLDGHSQSYTKLPIMGTDSTDGPEELTASSPDSSPCFVRRDSLPSKTLRSIVSSSYLPAPPILAHKIPHKPYHTDTDQCFSGELTPPKSSPTFSQVCPIPETVPEIDSYFQPQSPMLPMSPRSKICQKLNDSKQFYTLPLRRPSTLSNQSTDDTDNTSLHSETSMVLQISSATGQLEHVPRKRASSVKICTFEYNKLKTCPIEPMIMKLSEEPFSHATLRRRQSQLYRSCLGMETAV